MSVVAGAMPMNGKLKTASKPAPEKESVQEVKEEAVNEQAKTAKKRTRKG